MKLQAARLPWSASIIMALVFLAGALLSCGDSESPPEAGEARVETTRGGQRHISARGHRYFNRAAPGHLSSLHDSSRNAAAIGKRSQPRYSSGDQSGFFRRWPNPDWR